MKKLILATTLCGAAFVACKQSVNKESYSNLTRVDTIIYRSPKDIHKMDTLLLTVGIDTTAKEINELDTFMIPSPNPPYDFEMHLIKHTLSRKGQHIILDNKYDANSDSLTRLIKKC